MQMPAPKDPIRKELWFKKLSLVHRGKIPWNKGVNMPMSFRIKMGQLSKKFWTDPGNAEKINLRNKKVALSKFGDKNPMKRLELRLRASKHMKDRNLVGDLNPSRRIEVRAKISQALQGHTFTPEIRAKISRTLTGKLVGPLNPFYGKTHTKENKDKSRARAIKMITSGLLSSRRTQIELRIREALSKADLKFKEQTALARITVADFYLPEENIVIYCDGDYWHKGPWAKKHRVINKDKWQTKILETRGYKVFRFSETEINSSVDKCIDLIKNYLESLSYGKK